MSSHNHLTDLFNNWQSILLFGLLGLILALIVSFVQPLRYSSTVRLLILENTSPVVDAYTASRSEERIADNLSTIIYTSTFFDEVFNAGFTIDRKIFPSDDVSARRAWRQTIDATVARGSGLMTLTAYHTDVHQAEQIVRAVASVLTNRVTEFTSGNNVSVRLIDAPLNSRWPAKPDVPTNLVTGFFLGACVGIAYVFVQMERLRRRHQLG